MMVMKDRKRRPEGGEWEPQISFEIFGRCPKIKPQKQTHARSICSQANWWLDTSGDDKKYSRTNENQRKRAHEETSENNQL